MGDDDRIFHGEALLRRMVRYGLLLDSERKLDFVLGLTSSKLMERRLQTKVFKQGLAKSIHHARVLIRQRHIRVGRQICDLPPSWSGPTPKSTSTLRSRAPSLPTAAPAA